jgi:hypothetical protein
VFPVEVRLGLLETAGEALVTCIVRDAAAREPAEEDRVVGLGGRVRVESHPGVGSPCSFTVPAPPEVLP